MSKKVSVMADNIIFYQNSFIGTKKSTLLENIYYCLKSIFTR